jgi:hypothetical protein
MHRLPKKILISLSISFSPFISTSGLGILIPALAKRDPSPAAMIANFIIYQLFVDKDNENKVQYKIIPFIFLLIHTNMVLNGRLPALCRIVYKKHFEK